MDTEYDVLQRQQAEAFGLMKGGGMFPTEPQMAVKKPYPTAKGAPPGYEVKEVVVHRGGKMFKSTRYVKTGEEPVSAPAPKARTDQENDPVVVDEVWRKLKQVYSEGPARVLHYPENMPSVMEPDYSEKLQKVVDGMPGFSLYHSEDVAKLFKVIGWVENFKPNRVLDELLRLNDPSIRVKVGREYSPVLYIKTSNPEAVKAAMKRAKADEIHGEETKFVPKGYVRAWWD